MGTITVETGTTIATFKQAIFEELIQRKALCNELKINSADDFRLRNAKNAELGNVCKEMSNDGDPCSVDDIGLWDNKEFYVQQTEHENMVYQAFEGSVYNILVREWKPDTWEFGPIHEV